MSKKRRRLEMTVAAIQRRWGARALRRLGAEAAQAPAPCIPTGFPALDAALDGIGGLPRGRLTEILGAPTSGMATLALKIVASAQAAGDTAAYIDLAAAFDPDYADRCEVSLSKLLLVHPPTGRAALEIVHHFIRSRGAGVLVFDAVSDLAADPQGAQRLAAALGQIGQALPQAPCAAIFLTPLRFGGARSPANYPGGFALPHYAAVRLLLQKERWLYKQRDIRGYRAQVQVLKNKLGRAGKRATIAITFNGVVKGDST